MADLLVRWATRWDRKAVVGMVQALALQHGCECDPDTLGTAFEYALANPQKLRFAVAQIGDELVGTASLHEAYSTWAAQLFGTIEDFYVVADSRRQGVGSGLLDLLLGEARKRGYCRVQLDVQEDNDGAWQFYESQGFHFTGYLVYRHDLGEE